MSVGGRSLLPYEKITLLLPRYRESRIKGKAGFQGQRLSHSGKRSDHGQWFSRQHLKPFREEQECISVPVTLHFFQGAHRVCRGRGGMGRRRRKVGGASQPPVLSTYEQAGTAWKHEAAVGVLGVETCPRGVKNTHSVSFRNMFSSGNINLLKVKSFTNY